jgi:hypothetical protein
MSVKELPRGPGRLAARTRPDLGSRRQIFFQLEGRWDYGTSDPTDLSPTWLGSPVSDVTGADLARLHRDIPWG